MGMMKYRKTVPVGYSHTPGRDMMRFYKINIMQWTRIKKKNELLSLFGDAQFTF